MENRPRTGRLIFLGNPSQSIKQFLGSLQQTGFEIHYEQTVASLLGAPAPKNRVPVVLFEQAADSREVVETLRQSGRRLILIWIGKAFTKELMFFANEHRIHAVLENPNPEDAWVIEQFRKAVELAEASERSEDLIYSIKSVLLQIGDGGEKSHLINELKTGLGKFEKNALHNEFLGNMNLAGGETKLPFYKAQALADALMTVQDLERTGTLWVKSKEGSQGKVEFLQGRPVSASCGEARSLKAIYRMFLWNEPQFTFTRREAAETAVEETFELSLREICVEGEAFRARYEKVRTQIPPATLRLQLEPSSLHTGTQLDRNEFSTLSSVVEMGKVSQIIDYNPLPDVVLYECLIRLKKNGVIKVTAA